MIEPYAKGGKIGLFGGAGVGKTVLIQELIPTSQKVTMDYRFLLVLEKDQEKEMTYCEMLESGIVKYGDEFMEEMEKGNWPLDKINKEALKDSQAAFVFGQMNEPPGARAGVALSGLTLLKISEMEMVKVKGKISYSLSTIFLDLHKQDRGICLR